MSSSTEDEFKVKGLDLDLNKVKDRGDNAKKKKNWRFGCFRSDYGHPTIEESDVEGNIDMESATAINHARTHLVIMVNGIVGSAQDWRFAAKQFLKKYPEDLIVHCSECNYSTLTFDGVDVMGRRLADEVISVVKRHPNLQKISFIGHSLGGVVARYTIAVLYSQEFTSRDCQENQEHVYDGSSDSFPGHKLKRKIAGLEPVNFITVATPHLGSRGHRQVPLFGGVYALEKLASNISWFLGRTGKQLFLTDGDDVQPPLLLQMVSDHEDLKFMSALQSFKRRLVYANVHFDYLVGWSTSSIRRRNELPKRQDLSKNSTYPHVLKVETAKISDFPQESAAEVQIKSHKIDDLEETMIRALTKLSWERVDVSFKGSRQRYFAHSTIQVKGSWINSDGADVIQHIIDSFQLDDMLKQLPSRNQRTKGFKVKDALQICVLLVICVWLLYQANKIYHKKVTLESSGGIMANEVQDGLKLGRKGLNPLLEEELAAAFQKRNDDEEDEVKEKEKEANADDEIDGGDLQKTGEEEPELLDDLIDEDDGEKEEASKGAR